MCITGSEQRAAMGTSCGDKKVNENRNASISLLLNNIDLKYIYTFILFVFILYSPLLSCSGVSLENASAMKKRLPCQVTRILIGYFTITISLIS